MIQFITSVLKYTGIVLGVLVLSHIIEVKGVTLSNHVQHAMNWVGGIHPVQEVGKVGHEISESVQNQVDQFKKPESEFTLEDQKQLDELIKKSQQKKASR